MEGELAERHMKFGLDKTYTDMFASLDTIVKNDEQEIKSNYMERDRQRRSELL